MVHIHVLFLWRVLKEGDTYVIPHVHELLTPLVSVVALQLISYYAALHRDLDVDKPRNLAKSVLQ